MAEVLASMAIGPLVSMVKEKASSYLLEQYKVMEGMEEQHKILKRKLPAILDVIADAEMQATEHREGAKAWLQEVREVAYQGNDVFDEFKYEALRRKAKKEGHYHKLGMDVIKLFPTHNRIVFRYRMGNKLKLILQAIEVLIAEMNAFRFKFRPQQQLSMKWRQTDPEIIDPMKIASTSRAKEKDEVVDTLLGQKSNVDLTVLPIVGMGGLGKTTLAQLVYSDSKIQKHFQLRLWVCVSDTFDVDFLARSIVEGAPKERKYSHETDKKLPEEAPKETNKDHETDKKTPLDSLGAVVSGKRYLLVLDDVWNRDVNKWEKLKSFLQFGEIGSSVLTTTRDKSIAQFMGTTKAHELGLLKPSFIEEIIKAKAFISKATSPANELVGMVGDMAKRCVGSPLAATTLGSVLRTKTSLEEWKAILSRGTICDDETGILPILKLSYNDLPSQMRQCFSFCAVFPKGYEIDVENLIQLWMANGFIMEEEGACPEIIGKRIFIELASRSFFQDVKEIPFNHLPLLYDSKKYGYCSRITCKIHDLMHDVARSAMGKECATIATEPSKSEVIPYSTRHLFVPDLYPKSVLNGFLEESSPGLQTLLCTIEDIDDKELHFLSKYNSVRALQIRNSSSFLKPKYLHHLRYLDLSKSNIETLPEDISIMYHLQTLNLSGCSNLAQLPKGMKYMTALHHLYTDGCSELKMMPPELGCLASLRTLTWFVAGTPGPNCGDVAELGPLDDLGGPLEVRQLENVTETDVQAANLGNKKRLTELTLRWSETEETTLVQHDHNKVLEGLKPHEGIKVLKIYSYGGITCPAWMNTLHHVVELVLSECKRIEKLPPLWRLPALQVLEISGMENLQCICCGGDPPFTFKKLKVLHLYALPNLETWWDINEVQGQEPLFPELEKLIIRCCRNLTALPRASAVKESSSGVVNTTVWRSSCPALKELSLYYLTAFKRWEISEGTLGEHITTFPSLEELFIGGCPELTTLPEAPKLNVLEIEGKSSLPIELQIAKKYITSLSTLKLSTRNDIGQTTWPTDHCLIELVGDKKWSRESPTLRVLCLNGGWGFLFRQSSALALLWNFFVQLEDLEIVNCDALKHWPENVFQRLVSLRRLAIWKCESLTGLTEQVAWPPRLETLALDSCHSLLEVPTPLPGSLRKLRIYICHSLLEVPTLPASLTDLSISFCDKIESVILRRQQEMDTKDAVVIPASSTDVTNLSPFTTSLRISFLWCSNLQSLSVQLDCTESLDISYCHMLKSVDGNVRSLERLMLQDCKSLESIPYGPQAPYSSLRELTIYNCRRLKVLPPCLKQRLNDIEETDLEARYTETRLSRSWKRVTGKHC